MPALTISMAINGNAALQLSINELELLPGKFAIIASLVQGAAKEHIDLTSIQFFNLAGKLFTFEDRIILSLNSPRKNS